MNLVNVTHQTSTCHVLAFSRHIPRPACRGGATIFRQPPEHIINIQTTTYQKNFSVSAFRVAEVEEKFPSSLEIRRLVDFLHEHLPRIFDSRGIDPTIFDESVKFTDPITKYGSLYGFLFNIAILKKFFLSEFHFHWTSQVRKYKTFILEEHEEKLSNLSDTDSVTRESQPISTTCLAASEQEVIGLRKIEGGIAGVLKFIGKVTEEITQEKEKMLRSILIRDELKPEDGFSFARSNDPDPTWSFNFIMRNEVLIWLAEFSLD